MYKKPILLAGLALVMLTTTKAQENQPTGYRLQNVQFQFGGIVAQSRSATPLTFHTWALGSDLPNQSTQIQANRRDYGSRQVNGSSELLLTFGKNAGSEGLQRIYRIGLLNSNFSLYSYHVGNTTKTPYGDFSLNSGDSYRLDSINRTFYSFKLYSKQVTIDFNVLWTTNRDGRFNFYFGGGLNTGFCSNTVSLNRSEEVSIESVENQDFRKRFKDNHINERYTLATGFTCSFSLPTGVSYNLGKQNKFWSRLALTAEVRPGFNLTTVQDKGMIGTGYVAHNLGLKFKL